MHEDGVEKMGGDGEFHWGPGSHDARSNRQSTELDDWMGGAADRLSGRRSTGGRH